DVVFFFSSRRRHTRCLSDWSSDVCSSDLWKPSALMLVVRKSRRFIIFVPLRICQTVQKPVHLFRRVKNVHALVSLELIESPQNRSEERRVGKECRYRWAQYRSMKRTTCHG